MTDNELRTFQKALRLHTSSIGGQFGQFHHQVAKCLFSTMLKAKADVESGRLDTPLYAVPAPTGSGKSTYAAALIAALASHDESYSAVVCCETRKEAHATYCRLRQFGLGAEDLYVYTSEHSDLDEEGVQSWSAGSRQSARHSGLKQARIGVCTHKLLLDECREGVDKGVQMYLGRRRSNLLVDEYPQLVFDASLAPSDLAYLREQLSRLPGWNGARNILQQVEDRAVRSFEADGGRVEVAHLIDAAEYEVLAQLDRSPLGYGNDTEKRVSGVFEFLAAASMGASFLVRGSGVTSDKVRQPRHFQAYRRDFQAHPGLILLDATFPVSPMAKLFKGIEVVRVPEANYAKLQITHISPPAKFEQISRSNAPRDLDLEYLAYVRGTVLEHTSPGDEVLVIVHKRHEPKLLDPLLWKGRRVAVEHWGNGIGGNDHRNCTHVFAFSENHRPTAASVAEAFGLTGEPLSQPKLAKEALGSATSGSVQLSAHGHRLRWFKQMACRGRVRQIDGSGECGEMKLFTTMDKGLLLNHYRALFPGCPPVTSIRADDSKRQSAPAKLVDYVLGAAEDKLCSTAIAVAIGIEPKKVKTAFHLKRAEILRYEGWNFVPGSGRGASSYLIRKPHNFEGVLCKMN